MKAMILAAGLGTRLKPFTDHHPKALARVNGKTLLQRAIEYLKTYGITKVIVNVHHFASQIIEHINEHHGFGIQVFISDETEQVLETGGGLKKASWFFQGSTEPFFLMNVDILSRIDLRAMMNWHHQQEAMATLAVSKRNSSRAFLFNPGLQLCGWQHTVTGEERIIRQEDNLIRRAFSGIHYIHPDLLELMPAEHSYSMVDVYLQICAQHKVIGFEHAGDEIMDVGKPDSLQEAALRFG